MAGVPLARAISVVAGLSAVARVPLIGTIVSVVAGLSAVARVPLISTIVSVVAGVPL